MTPEEFRRALKVTLDLHVMRHNGRKPDYINISHNANELLRTRSGGYVYHFAGIQLYVGVQCLPQHASVEFWTGGSMSAHSFTTVYLNQQPPVA